MLDILTIGYLARDLSYHVSQFPGPNTEVFAHSFRETHGGSCGNVAAYASFTFGRNCAIRSVVGDDPAGRALLERLSSRDGVDVHNVITIADGTTSTITLVTNDKGEKMFFTYPGCVSGIDVELFVRGIIFDEAHFVYVAPCHPRLAFRTIEAAHRAGKTVAYNPGTTLSTRESIGTFNQILSYVDYLVLNKDESQRYSSQKDLPDVLAHYLIGGVRVLVVTDAHNGSIVADEDGILFQPAYRVNEVEPLGPGDAYASAFFASLCEEDDLRKAAMRGTQLGAYVVMRYGVREEVPTLDELMDFCSILEWREYQVAPFRAVSEWPVERTAHNRLRA